jgi:elongation factor 1 alpha-like protein
LLVAINKMDTVGWSQIRYDEITKKLGTFLKQTGFKENDVCYVPCSGLNGENLTKVSEVPELSSWYHGPCVTQQIGQ